MSTLPRKSDAVLERLTRLHPKLIDLTLGRTQRLLDRLGNPERKLPPVVHVAGTNGKGSTVAYLDACLKAAGYRVHVATSPHLVRFAERIRLDGKDIEEDALTALLEECETVNAGEPITFFEITTVAALLAFARAPGDAVILETGLGGKLDSTNVIDRPAATVITPIGLDHQGFLGDTLAAIAGEKAGILKAGVPCAVAKQEPAAAKVLRERASALRAPLTWEGENWLVEEDGKGFALIDPTRRRRHFPQPALPGKHQIHNAGLAIACLDLLHRHFNVTDNNIRKGLATVWWRARLQHLKRGPLLAYLPMGWELWLDGAHNPHAAEAIARFLPAWKDRPVHMVAGMLSTKDAAGFFVPFKDKVASLRTVTIPDEKNSVTAEDLAKAAGSAGLPAKPADSLAAALRAIVSAEPKPARVLIVGSLYLAGQVLAENG
jgi:dihydrofolate synthase / folylpolyglutamate synthase